MDITSFAHIVAFFALLSSMVYYIHSLYRDLETRVYRARRKE